MITRWTTYFTAIIPDTQGEWVLFEDADEIITELEYEIRFLKEQLADERCETEYWKAYFEKKTT